MKTLLTIGAVVILAGFFARDVSAGKQKPLEMFITKEMINLETRTITFKLNKAADKAETMFFDPGGNLIRSIETSFNNASPGSILTITWEPIEATLGRIEIKAYDVETYWVGYEITPFSVEIPHEDVVFETAKWDIRPSEVPKLEEAYKLLNEAIGKYGKDLQAQVYIGGFTDTVGSDADNQLLSERRALSIASFFRKKGMHLAMYYRGFGEKVPAVQTGDGVPEERNRRAVYILAAMIPAIGGAGAPGQWRLLQ